MGVKECLQFPFSKIKRLRGKRSIFPFSSSSFSLVSPLLLLPVVSFLLEESNPPPPFFVSDLWKEQSVSMASEVAGLLGELEYSLRSNPKQEKMSPEEELVFRNLKGRLVDTFLTGTFVTSLLAWKATKRYGYATRILYSAGTAFLGGTWACEWVLRSSLDPILAADGSRMQRELANIMLTKHQEDPFRPSFINKHLYRLLYPEQVFVDSHQDRPVIRWRLRNFYEDIPNAPLPEKPPKEQPLQHTKGVQRNPIRDLKADGDVIGDPLDCVFGYAESSQEIKSDKSSAHSRRITRAQKRAHRRHRTQDRDQSAGTTVSQVTN